MSANLMPQLTLFISSTGKLCLGMFLELSKFPRMLLFTTSHFYETGCFKEMIYCPFHGHAYLVLLLSFPVVQSVSLNKAQLVSP